MVSYKENPKFEFRAKHPEGINPKQIQNSKFKTFLFVQVICILNICACLEFRLPAAGRDFVLRI
jgi:hypothetical protein